jgi:hypothetical protein
MAELQTNFNVAPFYDDYDEDKMYYRILFRPSTAVQARELTQLQTMMQKQISRFGASIYKDGSVVEGCNFTQYPGLAQVKFKDSNTSTIDFTVLTRDITDVANTSSHLSQSHLLVSNTYGTRAAIFEAFTGAESAVNRGSKDTNRAYVIYLYSGNNAGVQVDNFVSGEQIDVYLPTQDKLDTLDPNKKIGVSYVLTSNSTVNALGTGFGLHVGQGIIYQKGFFLKANAGNFVIKEHTSNAVGIKVGYNTQEYIVKPSEDPSLYDNSIGSPNYNAPGAYRLKLVPTLVAYDSTNTDITIPKDFLPVVDFSGGLGTAVTVQEDPFYSTIGDIIAKRTKEESGDYIVKPFQINVEPSSNSQTMYYSISPGIAYVDGYRVEFKSPRRIEINRGITSSYIASERLTVNYGNYVKIRDTAGIFDIGGLQSVSIYNANQYAISRNIAISAPVGTLVGNATVRAIKYNSGSKGTPNAEYLLYLTNINMAPGYSFASNAKSIYVNGTYGKVFADIATDPFSGYSMLYGTDTTSKSLIFYTGLDGVKRLTSNTGVNNTSYIYRTTTDPVNVVRSGGKFTASFTAAGDEYNFGACTGISDSLSSTIQLYFNTDMTANIYTAAYSAGSTAGVANLTHSNITCTAVTGGTGSFITNYGVSGQTLRVGDSVKASYTIGATPTVSYHTITSIFSANGITVTPTLGGSVTAGSIFLNRFFKTGEAIDFDGGGNTIAFTTSAGLVTGMTATVSVDPEATGTFTVRAQIPQVKKTAQPIQKVVSKDRYIAINVESHPTGTAGPWSLGIPDVYKVEAIYLGAGFANTNPDRKDWFTFDNGQKDNYYGLASISINPQYKSAITTSTRLLARVSHFTPNISSSKATFFSVDSYSIDDANTANTNAIVTAQIPVYKDISGNIYDLRNHIDFRPVMSNTAVSTTSAAWPNYSVNPANSSLRFYSATGANYAIEPDSNFTYNIEYYLPRVDSLIINKDSRLDVKSSVPSFNPKAPIINNTGLKIADIYVTPYPSLTFSEAE